MSSMSFDIVSNHREVACVQRHGGSERDILCGGEAVESRVYLRPLEMYRCIILVPLKNHWRTP